ncbi:unnamed protein product [Linum trigynum]|uniref:Uncharacterized protein n=1 Tax=Linum trigynum TaxID=586398 RepID=A0AAV2F337_9ROSI
MSGNIARVTPLKAAAAASKEPTVVAEKTVAVATSFPCTSPSLMVIPPPIETKPAIDESPAAEPPTTKEVPSPFSRSSAAEGIPVTINANVLSSSAKKLAGNTVAVTIPSSPTRAPTVGKSRFSPEISTHGPGSTQEHRGQIRSTASTALDLKSVPLMSPINGWKFRKKRT